MGVAMSPGPDTPRQKTVVLLSTGLDVPIALNVVGHLAIAIGTACGAALVHTPNHRDRSGVVHLGVSAWPLIVLKTRPAKLRAAITETRLHPDLVIADYPRAILTTDSDSGLANALASSAEPELEYLGVMVHGTSTKIDGIFSNFALVHSQPGSTL